MNKQENGGIFHGDVLDRKQFIDRVFYPCCSTLLKRGGVLAVHAPFGYGKSKFAQYYKEYLNKEKLPNQAIIIDAFLHDYIDNPFIAIHKSIGQLVGYDEELHKLGKEILIASAQEIFDLVPILRKINSSSKLSKPSIDGVIKQYTTRLEKLANDTPITIIIDELDRCRPDYAVHFLERIKHYFGPVPNILFILMINKDQLFKSIGNVYGIEDKNDITNYFEKFLSYRIIELPMLSEEELNRGQSVEKENSYSYKILYSKFLTKISGNNNDRQAYIRFIETAAAFLHALELNYRYHDQVYLGIEIILAIIKKEQFFTKDTARVYAYLLVLSLSRPDIFKMLKEGQSIGHKLAHDLFNEIESRFYYYGSHSEIKDKESINKFFMDFKHVHYVAAEIENETKPREYNGFIESNFLIIYFEDPHPEPIRRQFQSWTNNIL